MYICIHTQCVYITYINLISLETTGFPGNFTETRLPSVLLAKVRPNSLQKRLPSAFKIRPPTPRSAWKCSTLTLSETYMSRKKEEI